MELAFPLTLSTIDHFMVKSILSRFNFQMYFDNSVLFLNMSKLEIERMKKTMVKVFKECGLSIIIECNLKTVNFLNVTFDLTNDIYKPYRKANDNPLYVNKNSSHPPCILGQLRVSIEKRLSETSSNENVFDVAAKLYNDALQESGFNYNLKYSKTPGKNAETETKENIKRKIIWFNPPFSKNVKTNIGEVFFKFLNKHFPPNSKLNKIFNRNTIKISYSYMRNIGSIISSHNIVWL